MAIKRILIVFILCAFSIYPTPTTLFAYVRLEDVDCLRAKKIGQGSAQFEPPNQLLWETSPIDLSRDAQMTFRAILPLLVDLAKTHFKLMWHLQVKRCIYLPPVLVAEMDAQVRQIEEELIALQQLEKRLSQVSNAEKYAPSILKAKQRLEYQKERYTLKLQAIETELHGAATAYQSSNHMKQKELLAQRFVRLSVSVQMTKKCVKLTEQFIEELNQNYETWANIPPEQKISFNELSELTLAISHSLANQRKELLQFLSFQEFSTGGHSENGCFLRRLVGFITLFKEVFLAESLSTYISEIQVGMEQKHQGGNKNVNQNYNAEPRENDTNNGDAKIPPATEVRADRTSQLLQQEGTMDAK